jgi:phosphonate transport system substrate-binding protein
MEKLNLLQITPQLEIVSNTKRQYLTQKKTKRNSFDLNRMLLLCFILMLMLLFFGCNQKTKSPELKYSRVSTEKKSPVYVLAIHPLHNPAKLIKTYQPLVDNLNKKLKGAQLSLEASRDYGNFENKYKNKIPQFILANPLQTLQAIKIGYTVLATAGESGDFKGIIIIRKDSNINNPKDLIGKKVSYPSPTALAACIMPQYFLYKHGVNINKDIKNSYVGSQESSIMNVYLKLTSAGATWPTPWRDFQKKNPKESSKLKIIWETETLINNSVMVRNDVPIAIKEQVQNYLIELDKTKEGKKILQKIETTSFLPATDKDYDVVRTYIEHFEKEVRKIETK